MEMIDFFVPGMPRGKGRPRFSRKTGRAYTDSVTKAYEDKIASIYYMKYGLKHFGGGDLLHMQVYATFPIPKSVKRATRLDMKAGNILPSRKPDIDNILKIAMDALNGVAYKDDACVTALFGKKLYGEEPGIRISIYKLPAGGEP